MCNDYAPTLRPEPQEDELPSMSFLEHLEELRARLLKALAGVGATYLFSILFTNQIWWIVSRPILDTLAQLGVHRPLVFTTPTEVFTTVWVKLPLLFAVFLASPWVLYQMWAFIAPGLYPHERRWAAPFVVSTAGLFITGGLFSYFLAFPYSLMFLLRIGQELGLDPMVKVSEYFDLFINVTLGIGLVFELPVLVFLLTLLGLASPSFLLRNSRYAIVGLTIVAAVITPTQDIVNLILLSVPLCALYFAGVLASYILVLHREERRLPWKWIALWAAGALTLAGAIAVGRGYRIKQRWPFLAR